MELTPQWVPYGSGTAGAKLDSSLVGEWTRSEPEPPVGTFEVKDRTRAESHSVPWTVFQLRHGKTRASIWNYWHHRLPLFFPREGAVYEQIRQVHIPRSG